MIITSDIRKQYTATIGIECHVQLKTATKLFSAAGNDAREAPPNTLVSHIDFGLPGALPVLNEEAVRLAVRAAFALDTEPQTFSYFERKHYFYPDLPMGYQISQLAKPIIVGGKVTFEVNDDVGLTHVDAMQGENEHRSEPYMEGTVSEERNSQRSSAPRAKVLTVRVNRVQMEADAGKSTHPAGKDYSLVDLNRAGTPLLEIVSEPDMHSAAEAKAYTKELYLRMRYADVSDCNLYYGNMRFDVNVSVSKTGALGTRTETKNINSFRAVEKTVEYEINRQIEVLEKGGVVVQETRGWDDAKQKTFVQRTKENAEDYRYMPDPDLPPIELDTAYIAKIRESMPVMPGEWRQRLSGLGLDRSQIAVLLESEADDDQIDYLSLIEQSLPNEVFARQLAHWFVNIEIPLRKRNGLITANTAADNAETDGVGASQAAAAAGADEVMTRAGRHAFYAAVFVLLQEGKLSSTNAKALISAVLGSGRYPADVAVYAERQGFIQDSDEEAVAAIVDTVLADNPKAVAEAQDGEEKVIGFLVGQVMKRSQGKANPQLAQQLIRSKALLQNSLPPNPSLDSSQPGRARKRPAEA